MRTPRRLTLVLSLSTALLAACGGGAQSVIPGSGGSGIPPAAATLGPVAAGAPITVADVAWRFENGATLQVLDADDDGRGALPGMVLRLEGAMDAGSRSASVTRSQLQAELRGPVSSVEAGAQRFQALGLTVQLDSRTVLDGLASLSQLSAGDAVQVHGLIGPDDSLLATRVQRRSSNALVKLSGQVRYDNCPTCAPAAGIFRIGTQIVNAGSAQLSGLALPIAAGTSVRVRATQAAPVLQASALSPYIDTPLLADAITRVRGLLTEPAPGQFQLQGLALNLGGTVSYSGGSAADLRAGREVTVEGRYRQGGVAVQALSLH